MAKPRTESEQKFIDQRINDALTNAGLPINSRLRGILDRDAEVFDTGRGPGVHIARPDCELSLRDSLGELEADPMYKDAFPKAKATIDKRDLRTMSEHFDEIASGKVTVR